MEEKYHRELPAVRTAREELPDEAAMAAAGLEGLTLEEARLCVVIWSWFLADGKAKTRSPLYHCLYCLGFAAGLDVRRDGSTEPAPHPDISTVTWPQAESVFRRLGIDHLDLASYWLRAKHEADDACYPLDWLSAFFPPAMWPMLVTLIEWGPERAAVQFEQVAIVMGQTPIQKPNRRRPPGSLTARSTIDTRLTSAWRLMRQFISVRTRVKGSPRPTLDVDLLDAWTHLPQKPDLVECGTVPSGLNNGGPSLAECRDRLGEFVDEYKQHPRYPWQRLRRVVLFSLMLLLGPRADALRTAMSTDYDPRRLWPDGQRRPTLTIRPGKTWEWGAQHYLPLPSEVAGWLEQWLALTAEKCGDQPRPIFPGRQVPGKSLRPLSQSGFYGAVAGHGNGLALLPLEDDGGVGVRPHAFRKAASELAHQGAVALKKKHPGVYDHLTPEHFSRALLAHTLAQSTADVYRSLDAERLTSLVVEEAWAIIWPPHVEAAEALSGALSADQIDALSLDLLRIVRTGDDDKLALHLGKHSEVLAALAELAALA
jgi:integrase